MRENLYRWDFRKHKIHVYYVGAAGEERIKNLKMNGKRERKRKVKPLFKKLADKRGKKGNPVKMSAKIDNRYK